MASDAEKTFGVRIIIADIPADALALVPARQPGETDEELARRSVLVRGLRVEHGEPAA